MDKPWGYPAQKLGGGGGLRMGMGKVLSRLVVVPFPLSPVGLEHAVASHPRQKRAGFSAFGFTFCSGFQSPGLMRWELFSLEPCKSYILFPESCGKNPNKSSTG